MNQPRHATEALQGFRPSNSIAASADRGVVAETILRAPGRQKWRCSSRIFVATFATNFGRKSVALWTCLENVGESPFSFWITVVEFSCT